MIRKTTYLIILFLYSCACFAQTKSDTVFYDCFDRNCDPQKFGFSKPTVLVLHYRIAIMAAWKNYSGNDYYHYSNGKLNGPYYRVLENGMKTDSGNYVNGLREGEFIQWEHSSGRITSLTTYRNGKIEGENVRWSWDGSVEMLTNYRNGKKEGKETAYYHTGQKAVERSFRNDSIIDSIYYWYASGEKMKAHYNCTFPEGLGCKESYYGKFEDNFGIGFTYEPMNTIKDNLPKEEWLPLWEKDRAKYCLYQTADEKDTARYGDGSFISLKDIFSLQYDTPIYVLEQKGDWWKVLIRSNRTNYGASHYRKLWIRRSVMNRKLITWQEHFTGKWAGVLDVVTNPILVSPSEKSVLTSCQYIGNCLHVIKIKGDWAQVEILRASDCGANTQPGQCFDTGWVKWRDEKQLLIK
jgi:hypothetical protein